MKERRKLDRRRARKGDDEEDRFWRNLHNDRRKFQRRRVDPPVPLTDDTDDGESFEVDDATLPTGDGMSQAIRADQETDSPDAQTTRRSPGDFRRDALKSMLLASEARIARASRLRRPVLSRGATVRVLRGQWAGLEGVIEDADYIESRVLIRLDPSEPARWVPFRRVGHADPDD